MVTQEHFKEHYRNLHASRAIYVWGANGEIITKELVDRLYGTYGSSKYNRAYYDNKLIEGQGKIGADCSGSIYQLSKKDATAKGYYQACNKKGSIDDLPVGIACLVFNKDFTHVGAYMGDGTTIEMMSSKRNCVKQTFQKSRWAYYGIPNWLETDSVKPAIANVRKEVIKNIQKWCNDYCNASIVVDGIYGPKTKAALCKALQTYLNKKYNAGLVVDGDFGDKTKEACKTCKGKNELSFICQAMLYCKGYELSKSIKNDKLDGSYGSETKNVVMKYQKDTRGLRHDGKCGPATFYAMFNS